METKFKTRFAISRLLTAELQQQIKALTQRAEQARCVRALDEVDRAANRLAAILPQAQMDIARYYFAIARNQNGRGTPESLQIFESLLSSPMPIIRARAHLALGVSALIRQDTERAIAHSQQCEAAFDFSSGRDAIGLIHLTSLLALISASNGQRQRAINDLLQSQRIITVTKLNQPAAWYNCSNSIANELFWSGQLDEAHAMIQPVVLSPFAGAYPEWQHTASEISNALISRSRAHSTVTMSHRVPTSATVHCMQEYLQRRQNDEDQSRYSALSLLYECSESADPADREYINWTVNLLRQHTSAAR